MHLLLQNTLPAKSEMRLSVSRQPQALKIKNSSIRSMLWVFPKAVVDPWLCHRGCKGGIFYPGLNKIFREDSGYE